MQPSGLRIRKAAANPQPEAKPVIVLRFLHAPRKRMNNTALPEMLLPQYPENIGMRLAHMQDDRQIMDFGKLQLVGKEAKDRL